MIGDTLDGMKPSSKSSVISNGGRAVASRGRPIDCRGISDSLLRGSGDPGTTASEEGVLVEFAAVFVEAELLYSGGFDVVEGTMRARWEMAVGVVEIIPRWKR